jgi:hypothetical protein
VGYAAAITHRGNKAIDRSLTVMRNSEADLKTRGARHDSAYCTVSPHGQFLAQYRSATFTEYWQHLKLSLPGNKYSPRQILRPFILKSIIYKAVMELELTREERLQQMRGKLTATVRPNEKGGVMMWLTSLLC